MLSTFRTRLTLIVGACVTPCLSIGNATRRSHKIKRKKWKHYIKLACI